MYSIVALWLAGFLAGSVARAQTGDSEKRDGTGPREKIFISNYEDVVEAVNRVVASRYVVQKDDSEAGIYESQFVTGGARYRPPHKSAELLPSGFRYRIQIRYVRTKVGSRDAVKVQVTKISQIRRDFFSEPTAVESDGYEEDAILYRIGRELTIKKAISKFHERETEKQKKKR